jgi:hypothetical protein
MLTASSSALVELQELRRENALLHERLRAAEAGLPPPAAGQTGAPTAMAARRPPPGQPAPQKGLPRHSSLPAAHANNPQARPGPGGAGAVSVAAAAGPRRGSAPEGVLASMPPSALSVAELRSALSANSHAANPQGASSPMAADTLAQATHRVTSRALGAGVRMSTVGQVLPGAAARAQAGAVGAMPPPGMTASQVGGADRPGADASAGAADDPAARLGQLMAARSALARQRLADEVPPAFGANG